MPPGSTKFHLYRFQILPDREHIQKTFGHGFEIQDREDLVDKKNDIFLDTLERIKEFDHQSRLDHRILLKDEYFVVLRLQVERDLDRFTKDEDREKVESWPFAHILINAHPRVQKIAIEHNYKAFSNTRTVANILEKNVRELISEFQLGFYLESIWEKNSFWEVAEEYEDRITGLGFEIISPNLANLHETLSDELQGLAENTNTQKTNLELNSNNNSHLILKKDDTYLDDLLDYTSEGGGSIKFRIKNLNKTITTDESVKEVSVDELELEASTEEDIEEAQEFLKTIVE